MSSGRLLATAVEELQERYNVGGHGDHDVQGARHVTRLARERAFRARNVPHGAVSDSVEGSEAMAIDIVGHGRKKMSDLGSIRGGNGSHVADVIQPRES